MEVVPLKSIQRLAVSAFSLPVALGLAAAAGAQTLEGVVEGADSRVLVRLLDDSGTVVANQVTDPSGHFLLAAPGPGAYTARVERMGYRALDSDTVRVDAGARTNLTLALPHRPLALQQAPRPEPGSCSVEAWGDDRLALAWSSVTTAMAMMVWNAERGELLLDARIHRRELEADGRTVVRSEAPVERSGVTRLVPAVNPRDLLARGFIREDQDGGTLYFSPTPAVLSDSHFLDHYCLRLQGPENSPLVGVAFEPRSVPEAEARPGVAGVVWLARDSGRPVLLEFAYRQVDPQVVPASAGGQTAFAELPDGSWVTAETWLRMPLVEVVDDGVEERWQVMGLREERARLVRVRDGTNLWTVTPESGAVTGRVLFREGEPLEGAQVELVGTGIRTLTDPQGAFRFDGLLEGVYRVSARHPRFESLPLGPAVPAVEVTLGETATVTLEPPSAEGAALQLCPTEDARVGSVVVTGQVVDSLSGEPLAGLPLNLRFRDPRREGNPYHEARVSSGAGGYYVYCDAPRGQTVRIRPALPGARVQDDLTFVALSPVERQDIPVRLSTEQRSGGLFGLIRDARTGQGIEAVEVRVRDTDYRTLTNSNGFFAIADVMPGLYAMTISHLAYEDREVVVRMDGGQAYQVNVELEVDAIPIEGITVTVVPRRLFGDMVDLQRRMELGFGDFMIRDELDSRSGTLATALQGRLGVKLVTGSSRPGERFVVLRQARDINFVPGPGGDQEALELQEGGVLSFDYCFPSVWVDGRRFSQPRAGGIGHTPVDFTQFMSIDIEAVEVYRGAGSVPGEFGGGDAACGAVVIWSRRGGRTIRGEMDAGIGHTQGGS